jgi:hypothetical protein
MIVVLLTVPGLPQDMELNVTSGTQTVLYPCTPTAGNASVLACNGPDLALGSRMVLEVRSPSAGAVIAKGEFVLTALAMPTVAEGVDVPTGTATITPRETRTPIKLTPYPNPTP